MHIFISHSSKEAGIADKLCETLETSGYQCFIAPRDIRTGHEYAEEIANGIDGCDAVLLVLSKASNVSPHVLREIERAVTRSIPILVYAIEKVELTKSMEYFLMTHQWLDAKKDSYEDVVACIAQFSDSWMEKREKRNVSARSGKSKALLPVLAAAGVCIVIAVGAFVLGNRAPKQSQPVAVPTTEAAMLLPENAEETSPYADLQLGDTFTMGVYNEEPIEWRVLKLSEDGKEAVVVAKDVLTIKAFDAPDSGEFGRDEVENYAFNPDKPANDPELAAYVYGSSSWEHSTIRTWLNSDAENVKYEGQEPTSRAMADLRNGYNTEKGFLCSFTEEELARIKDTPVTTKGNVLEEQDEVVTQDKVFLLSQDELKWFEEANVSLTAAPTDAAAEKDESYWYREYCLANGAEATMWWLRDPAEGSSCECLLVGNGYYEKDFYSWKTGVESFGIRPAMTIDISNE